MRGSILVAEDEAAARDSLVEILSEEGYQVYEAADGQAAVQLLEELDLDLILCDLKMPGSDGLTVLRQVRERAPQTLVLLMTAYGSVETAVEALRWGVQDYLLKPLLFEDLLHKIDRLLTYKQQAWELQLLRREANQEARFERLVGRSPAMQEVVRLIGKVAPTNATVLITGESGTGKEVVARLLHAHSDRPEQMFLPINCSAIPETLLESQLFGHTKGAFTGAAGARDGLFQRARGGTVFLDEIGELPLPLQAKLLRVVEEKEILPLGATTPVTVDVRLLAATNRDLKQEVESGQFREDLYYRLHVIGLSLPPLRDRREDIPPLIDYLVQRHNRKLKTAYKGVGNAAMKLLLSLPWKGNVRELDNVLERAMILGDGEWITPADLPHDAELAGTPLMQSSDNLREAVRAYERRHIEKVLSKMGGDKRGAAELLGVSLSSLYRKLDDLAIPAQD